MNIQRNIILIALAVVSYLMIQQWNKDYIQTQSLEQKAVVNEATVSATIPSIPTSSATASDIPSQPSAPPAVAPVQANSAVESGQLIQVETDVFSLKIDPVGGDIVYVGLKKYPQSKEDPNPFILLNHTKDHTFIAQSGLIGDSGTDDPNHPRPTFSAAKIQFDLADDAKQLEVPLTFTQANGALITKTYVFERDNYKIGLRYDIKNNAIDKPWKGSLYTQLKRDNAPDPSITSGLSSMPTYLGAAYWTPDKPFNKLKFGDFVDKPINLNHKGGWVAVVQHYFVSAWISNPQDATQYKTAVVGEDHILSSISPMIEVAPGQSKSYDVNFYAGPKIQSELKQLSPGLDLAVDYGILFFVAKILFWLLKTYHGLIGNWGIAIILLTVTVKAFFFYPSAISYRSMAKMRKIGPRMAEMKERFGNDRAALSQAMMKLYQEEKVNPFGGCLPILIQMPVFIALYWVLLESVELRQSPFFGWIKDLSVMDPLFVLPVLMTLSMVVQQRLNPAPPDPMQAQMMKWMPLIFGVMFLWFPAGLVMYWVTNNVLSIAQQWVITKKIENDDKHHHHHHKK